jgi:hypothetical protein
MITREDQIEQSVQNFVKAGLIAAGYGTDLVKVRDAFPTLEERATPMDVTNVAVGFNFDDGGRSIELGSDLKLRVYTVEFWTFGMTPQLGRNVANVIKTILEDNGYLVPLQDVGTAGHPVIDQLVIPDDRGITVARQINNDPRPWDMNVWTTIVKLEDTYYPSLVN